MVEPAGWIVINMRHATLVSWLALMLVVRSDAETIRGVLYSIHHGEGRNPAGQVVVAVEGVTYTLDYAPQAVRFKETVCYEIGSIWTAEIKRSDGDSYITHVICSGAVDKNTHEPWLVVREYLNQLAKSQLPRAELLSSNWRSSTEFAQQAARHFDFRSYLLLGEKGNCLDVARGEHPGVTQIGAGLCPLNLGQPGVLRFSVARNTTSGTWQIDKIEIVAAP
ncbi:MAG: hypothetical protein JWN34_387 [Bryobacterales bacterium]|nr:hypothetical protein [Bryobacterales bacterium]